MGVTETHAYPWQAWIWLTMWSFHFACGIVTGSMHGESWNLPNSAWLLSNKVRVNFFFFFHPAGSLGKSSNLQPNARNTNGTPVVNNEELHEVSERTAHSSGKTTTPQHDWQPESCAKDCQPDTDVNDNSEKDHSSLDSKNTGLNAVCLEGLDTVRGSISLE